MGHERERAMFHCDPWWLKEHCNLSIHPLLHFSKVMTPIKVNIKAEDDKKQENYRTGIMSNVARPVLDGKHTFDVGLAIYIFG